MYIPKHFIIEDEKAIFDFIEKNSLASYFQTI
jgi:predicted FMN-binding regulatory protein PaiB